MRKFFLVTLLLLSLAAPLLAGHYKFDSGEQKHIRTFSPKKKGNISPNVRKCMDVKCKDGTYCFHGRCIKLDNKCMTVKCSAGFRCVNGTCVQRKHQPKRLICPPLGFKLKKEQCDKDLKKSCKKEQIKKAVCGFNPSTKEYFDFYSPCDACENKNFKIKFFYSVPCSDAPRICDVEEECMNGICTTLLNDAAFENNESCNENSDCAPFQQCASHKCIDKRDLYNFLDSRQEDQNILVKMA